MIAWEDRKHNITFTCQIHSTVLSFDLNYYSNHLSSPIWLWLRKNARFAFYFVFFEKARFRSVQWSPLTDATVTTLQFAFFTPLRLGSKFQLITVIFVEEFCAAFQKEQKIRFSERACFDGSNILMHRNDENWRNCWIPLVGCSVRYWSTCLLLS